jgi:hypothetical protein
VTRAVVLAGVAILVAACSIVPVPPVRIDLPEPECFGISSAEAGRDEMCQEMFETVRGRFPAEVATASRIVIADTCPPRVLCDRATLYSAAAVVVPGDGDLDRLLALHVFGHQGQALDVEPWRFGPLPNHVANLLNRAA